MTIVRIFLSPIYRRAALLLLPLAMTACASVPAEQPGRDLPQIAALTRAIIDLGPGVDPAEAARAARISYVHTNELAVAYRITDPPLIHNTKVNLGLKPRGLCWHWAADMEARLLAENFQTLDLHRAIANHDKRFRIEHSTAIISRRGDAMAAGIVLDPWRKGGVLTWLPVPKDTAYGWVPNHVVHAQRRGASAGATKSPGRPTQPLALRP